MNVPTHGHASANAFLHHHNVHGATMSRSPASMK
jgi:hypothetical protein